MTPEQERALLAAAEAGLDDEVRDAFRDLMALIAAGVVPREAVQTVMATFQGEMASTMAAALSAIMGASVGAEAVVALEVGAVQLSRRVYLEAQAVGDAVQGIVQRHALGWQDARRLALELFEGYGFRDPDAETLKIDPDNPRLPQYLRDALLPDELLRTGIERELAKLQVANLSTPALRAAYADVLAAFDAMEGVEGQALLEKRLEVAFFERVRYWATRIARTELHRAYAEREARLLLDDPDVEFVQIRRAPGRGEPCICVLMTGRDLYGLGPGVYPKAFAPVPPFHPFCLPGDALITASGGIAAVTRRWFDGDLVVIATASGKRLASTVNHPVLTRGGWVAAGALNVGDQVISRVVGEPVGGDPRQHHDHQDVPASIAEIADAFARSGGVAAREVPMAAEHFHGDGVRGEVAVVWADRKLWDRVDAALEHRGADGVLVPADPGSARLLGDGVADLGSESARDSAQCVVCGGDKSLPLVTGHAGEADALLLSGGSLGASLRAQSEVDDVAADAELARQIKDGATGDVFADDVVVVERKEFHGYVFNLETEHGHYTANGIVTHNCRCVMSPRLDLTGRTAADRDADGDAYFLRRIDNRTAARIMGSQARRDRVLDGATAEVVTNSTREPLYHIRTAGALGG